MGKKQALELKENLVQRRMASLLTGRVKQFCARDLVTLWVTGPQVQAQDICINPFVCTENQSDVFLMPYIG